MAAAEAKSILLPEYRYEKSLKEGECVLLILRENHPKFTGENPVLRRIDRYFDALTRHWLARWEGPLLDGARAAAPSHPWSCWLDFHLTRLDGEYLSLWWEAGEDTGSARPRRIREGEIWRLADGVPLSLPQLLGRKRWRQLALDQTADQIRSQLEAGTALYYEDWPRLCQRNLSPHRCYLTPEGPVVFFPFCSIAPALENFPSFPLHTE